MNSYTKKIWLAVLMTFFIVCTIAQGIVFAKSDDVRTAVKDNTLPILNDPNLKMTAKLAGNTNLFLILSLNTYEPQSAPVLSSVSMPMSTAVMPEESAAQQKVNLVKSFLKKSGFNIVNVLPDLSAIWVEGSVASVESAFRVSINQYQLGNQQFFAADGDPSIPMNIADTVVAIVGLENYLTFKTNHIVASYLSRKTTTITPAKENVGPPYDPYEIRSAYNFTNFYKTGSPNQLKGTGINVAILDAYGDPTMLTSDWSKFCTGAQSTNLSGPWQGGKLPTTPAISISYPTGTPVTTDSNWALETALDVEWVHSIAPGAKINLVISKDNSFAIMLAAFQSMVTNAKGAVISMSFGLEEYIPAPYITAWDAASRIAAKKGITLVASTGDAGYESGHIQYPASDPYTLAIGGTSLYTTGTYPGNYSYETAWSGSGGGESILFPKQAWQYGTGVPTDSFRDTPDVSMDANPSTGVYVYCGFDGGWYQVGGTSLSAPLWAGFLAIVDQGLGANASIGGIGLANPWLYRVFQSGNYSSCFHDITSGNNGGFSAGTGYDLVTGIGTPIAWNLFTIGSKYMRIPQTITSILNAKAIAVDGTGNIYVGTFNWYSPSVVYELEKGAITPRALFITDEGVTDIAVDKNNAVYVMTYTTLYKYNSTTDTVSVVVHPFGAGWGVCVDTNLNIYYTDLINGTYWIPHGGSPALLHKGYAAGVCVDSNRNIYVTDATLTIHTMNAAHTTWSTWKNLTIPAAITIDLQLDSRKTAYVSCYTFIGMMHDYELVIPQGTGTLAENLWLDSKGGVYWIEYPTLAASMGVIKYLPPETPT